MQLVPVYEDWPSQSCLIDHFNQFIPFVIRNSCHPSFKLKNAVTRLEITHTIVDVSCTGTEESFCGNPEKREKVNMKISDIMAAWVAERECKNHWVLDIGLNLYLSQSCMFSARKNIAAELSSIAEVFPTPVGIQTEMLQQTNLWMNIQPMTSTAHYDSFHNVLMVLAGAKTATIFSPRYTSLLKPYPAFHDSPNHSRLTPKEVDALFLVHQHNGGCYRVQLQPGDSLFIPEGWWHQLVSEKCSMAVNYWFASRLQCLQSDQGGLTAASVPPPSEAEIPTGKHVSLLPFAEENSMYILRTAFYSVVQQTKKRRMADISGDALNSCSSSGSGSGRSSSSSFPQTEVSETSQQQMLRVYDSQAAFDEFMREFCVSKTPTGEEGAFVNGVQTPAPTAAEAVAVAACNSKHTSPPSKRIRTSVVSPTGECAYIEWCGAFVSCTVPQMVAYWIPFAEQVPGTCFFLVCIILVMV
jgi:hypothetical protein